MMKTRAAVLRKGGEPWEITELDLDEPEAGEVLVRHEAAGLCHSDEHIRATGTARLPLVGGHEGAGVVEKTGPNVTRVSEGDRVACSYIPVCGTCRYCSTGHQNLCDAGKNAAIGCLVDGTFRFHDGTEDLGGMCVVGSFSQYAVLSEWSCVKIEDDIPFELAALVSCGVTTGFCSAIYAADVRPGETVVVFGTGGVGMNAVQGARYAGGKHVIAIDPVEFKREQAMEFGATHAFPGPEEALEQVGRNCTVYLAAVNAAMAGCLPEYFPVVLAAFDAVMRERAARGGGWQSTSGPAPMIVVNGPVRHELGFNTQGGAFGPGFRPNATVARAIGLIVRNAFGIRPHVLEQATQGLPGRWSICLAENEEESPWPPFAIDGGQPAGVSAVSATLLRTCEFVDNRHTPDPEQVLWDVADTISRTGSLIFRDSSAGVVFCPEHAQMLAKGGYAKADVQAWLMEHCGRTGADLRRAGKNGLRGIARFADADTSGDDTFSRILPSPRHVPIVVAGARNAAISMVVRIFGEWSGTASPVESALTMVRP